MSEFKIFYEFKLVDRGVILVWGRGIKVNGKVRSMRRGQGEGGRERGGRERKGRVRWERVKMTRILVKQGLCRNNQRPRMNMNNEKKAWIYD